MVVGDDQLAPALLHKSKAQRDNPHPRRSQAMAATGTVVGRPSCMSLPRPDPKKTPPIHPKFSRVTEKRMSWRATKLVATH
jgi:hypothetical protein